MVKRVVLITGHYWYSQRKAGFHWLADALWHQGWEVIFMTAALSWLSVIRQDYRLKYPVLAQANQLLPVDKGMWSYIWFTPWHPANLRSDLLNNLSRPLFRTYNQLPLGAVEPVICEADLFIFESTPALLLFERFKQLNPSANYIYRVSDDLRLLRNHPVVLETQEQIAPKFDLISTPSQAIYRLFAGLPKLKLHLHGIRKDLFAKQYANPYPVSDNPNVIFVGNSYFDREFLKQASQIFPDWHFHIIGPLKELPQRNNIITYGELPFAATIPYLQHADIALHTLHLTKNTGIECFSDSLKVIQYTYYQLPIIAPVYLSSSRSHFFYYQPGDPNSIKTALTAAQTCNRSKIETHEIYGWDEVVYQLLRAVQL